MLVMGTIEDPADPIRKLISAQKTLRLDHVSLAVDPLGLNSIEPRTLFRQKAGHYPYSSSATIVVFDSAVVGSDPASHFMALMPTGVVPEQEQGLFAPLLKPVAAPPKKLRGYGTHRAAIDKPQPRLLELWQIQPVAGEGFGVGIVLCGFFFEEAHRPIRFAPGVQRGPLEAGEPGLVLETQRPLRMGLGEPDQPLESPFFGRIRGPDSRSSVWPAPSVSLALLVLPGWSRH
jgi:hypothetical protein